MTCPWCHAPAKKQRTWKTIPLKNLRIRIRACLKCGKLYQTVEKIDDSQQDEFLFPKKSPSSSR